MRDDVRRWLLAQAEREKLFGRHKIRSQAGADSAAASAALVQHCEYARGCHVFTNSRQIDSQDKISRNTSKHLCLCALNIYMPAYCLHAHRAVRGPPSTCACAYASSLSCTIIFGVWFLCLFLSSSNSRHVFHSTVESHGLGRCHLLQLTEFWHC
jgi:hypothetical protein